MTDRERLIKVIECEGMSAKQFSEEVGIGAGTLSNITGGRNNPSLDVMQRVLARFRTLNPQWLIMGTGQMYLNAPEENNLFSEVQSAVTPEQVIATPVVPAAPAVEPAPQKTITKIIIYFSDGTYEER